MRGLSHTGGADCGHSLIAFFLQDYTSEKKQIRCKK